MMSRKFIEYLPIDLLIPYGNNPRKNDKAVDAVAASIKEFGFQQAIVIDIDNVVVAGHTRLKAAKKLGMQEVPCIRADDLTAEQVKAFRLADNKVGEIATWDEELLAGELLDLDMDMDEFGFEMDDLFPAEDEPYEPHEHNSDVLKLSYVDMEETAGKWQMPILKPCDHIPTDLIPFHWAYPSTCKETEYKKGVHFYIYDYLFERFWNRPEAYLDKLSRFDCVLTPDFSMYLDMPLAAQMWSVYRSRLMGKIMQDYGIRVIPSLMWSTPDSFEFCFEGLPKHSVVSVSTVGVMRDKEAQKIWVAGMDEAMRVLDPAHIVAYGKPIEYDFGCDVTYIANPNSHNFNGRE